jgi:DNA-binding HxlR family transcriptional regulator
LKARYLSDTLVVNMPARTKTYQHFCPIARSLEVIGEKWSLLIVRDLLGGPQRFTDLLRGLNNLTPKWLTLRLRDLEAAGVVERIAEEGKREVWYQLTPTGKELGPVISSLNAWGIRHAIRPLEPGEQVRPGALVRSFHAYLVSERIRPAAPATWQLRFGGDTDFVLTFDGRRWSYARGTAEADVTVETTPEAWATMLATHELGPPVSITGSPGRVEELRAILLALLGNPVPSLT